LLADWLQIALGLLEPFTTVGALALDCVGVESSRLHSVVVGCLVAEARHTYRLLVLTNVLI
jgi:hypothetical protein